MGALDTAVPQGKALYVGISSYSAAKTAEATAILRGARPRLVIHQPSYSMLNRWIEEALLTLGELGIGHVLKYLEEFRRAPGRPATAHCRPGRSPTRRGRRSVP